MTQPPTQSLRPGALVTPDQDTLTADVVIIGSGMGGGTLAWALKDTGLDVLIVERGQFLPREPENSQPDHVFIKKRYVTSEPWYDAYTGKPFQPGVYYWVGGNTKMYGACLPRFRRSDFEETVHRDGPSPAWPFSYDDLEPHYAKAEELFEVHGAVGEDPTEPPHSTAVPVPAAQPRTSHRTVRRTASTPGSASVPHGGRHAPAVDGRTAGRRHLRRLPLPHRRQERRREPGRPARARVAERPAPDRCLRPPAAHQPRRAHRHRRRGSGRRAYGADRGQDVRRVRRRGQLLSPVAALGQRPAPRRTRQLLRTARPQLHGSQQHVLHGRQPGPTQRDRLAEDPRPERLVRGRSRQPVPARQPPDARQAAGSDGQVRQVMGTRCGR